MLMMISQLCWASGDTYKVVVETGYLALRNAKGYDYNNEIGELYTGEFVDVVDRSDDTYWWVYSSKYDEYGYVNRNYLVKTETSAENSNDSSTGLSEAFAKILAQARANSSGNYDSHDDYSTVTRNVLEENTLSAVIDGEEVVFYLVESDTDDWLEDSGGDTVYSATYASYTGNGAREYAFTIDISDRASGNTRYTYSDDMVFKFSFKTMPDSSGNFEKIYRLWRGNVYNDDHYSNYGSFSLTLEDCSSSHLQGTLDCELTYSRYSSSAEDGYYYDTSDVVKFEDIRFDFSVGMSHPVADEYEMNGSSAYVSGNINHYPSYNEGWNDDSGDTWTKSPTRNCIRCGGTGKCPVCHGDGKGIVRGEEYGPSDCDFCSGGQCSSCHGKGWVYN